MKKVLSILLVLFFAASLAAQEESKVSFTPDMRLIFQYGLDLDSKDHLFNLERAYIGLKAKLDNVSFRITGDIKYDSNTDVKDIYLKYAYAEVDKLLPMSKFIFGQQKTGLIDFEQDGIWGHRAIAKVPTDLHKNGAGKTMDTSADMGLSVDMKLPNKLGGLHLGYFAGEGYKKDTEEEGKEKALSLRANLNLGPLMVTAYVKTWWEPAGADNQNMFGAIVSFKNDLLSVAAEFFMKDSGTTAQIIAAYATFHAIPKKLDIFARFDMNDPDIDVEDNGVNHLYLGLKYFLASKTSVAAFFRSYMPSVGDNANSINFSFDQKF